MIRKYLIFCLLLAGISISCAPYRMKAVLAYRDKNYESALNYNLSYIRNHPNDQTALDLLNKSAIRYFEQTKRQIEHFERIEDWQNLLQITNRSYDLLSQAIQVVGITHPTKAELEYLLSVKDQSKMNSAQEAFDEAMRLYNSGDYQQALGKFNEVNSMVKHYRNTDDMIRQVNEMIAEMEYRKAKQLLMSDDLENALMQLESVQRYVPNYRDTHALVSSLKHQLADRYFEEADRSLQNADYLHAHQAMEKVMEYRGDYPGARERLKEVEDKLTRRIAVFPFEAQDLPVSYGDMAAQKVIAELLGRRDKFIKVLERQNLEKIFEEQALSQTGAIDEATAVEVGKLGGVNTIVLGTISLVSYSDSPTTKETKVGTYNRVYRDVRNVKREKKETFHYSLFEKKRSVEVNVNYRLIDVETGEIMESHAVNSVQTDAVSWVNAPKARMDDLPASVKDMATTAKSLKPKDNLINSALSDASSKVSNFIISKISKGGI
ncbi:hypothetical protein JXB12_10100 [candidate division KSB1 bacterium]|nr:hypothetical protein [candidate division KSB1 bacterium]